MNPRGLCLLMSLLLCSCATEYPLHSRLPATVAMNQEAGRGNLLLVVVRLPGGKKLPLVVDTGSPVTAFDKSLEPELGRRLDTGTLVNFGVKQDVGVYAAPKLYLGKVPLQLAGTNIVTFDPKKLADPTGPAFRGFIGMDVLQNYCLQLDFAAGQLRFLDDERADKKNWGTPFPLTDIGDGCFSINENLAGATGPGSMIDTGCNYGGWLVAALFHQWTNQESAADEKIYSPDGTLGGVIYHDLDLHRADAKSFTNDDSHLKLNGIGLRALADNLVTLDFPKRTLYLRPTSDWPLAAWDREAAMKSAGKSSMKSLKRLSDRSQLPGASKADHGKTIAFHFDYVANTATWDILKDGDSSIYHYTFIRASKEAPWKLEKAWRTDPIGHTTVEYLLP